jgi:RHS repeat-associated protein
MNQKQYYEYDAIGNMTRFIDRNGNNTSYEYDGLNRILKQINSKEGEKSFEYNEFGQILKSVDKGSKIEYNYNARGNIESIVRDLTNESFVYDVKGNVTDHYIEDKGIGTIATGYEYDKINRVTKVYTPLGVQSISYDKANRIVKSENNKNGMSKSYTYSPQGTVNTIKTRQDDKLEYSEYYEYDKNGNKTYSDENGNIKKYNYDGMGRLQRVVDNNAVQTEYEFDAYNNISKEYQLVGTDVSTKSYYYDANNRLTLATTKYDVEQFDYDKEGNLTHKKEGFGKDVSTTYYKYDGYNRLKNVISDTTEAEYHYNIEGLRDKKTVDGVTTRFTYDGDKIAGEYTEGEYYKYYRANELIGYVNNIDESYYYRQNSHGDVTAILDYQGKELKSYDYTPYGKQKEIRIEPKGSKTIIYQWEKETDKTHNPFKYAGEFQDEETGNIYLRARYYDVNVGRFTQEDSIKDGLNWYGYCGNNPVNFWDPSGMEFLAVSGGKYGTKEGYNYEFIEPALKKIREWRKDYPNENITWLICMAGWGADDFYGFQGAISDLENVAIKDIYSFEDLIWYINNKTGGAGDRSRDKIKRFIVFSHGQAGALLLGHGQNNADKFIFNKEDIARVWSDAFDSPNSWFGSCGAGNGGDNSFAQIWVNQVGGTTWGVVGLTTYEYINQGNRPLEMKARHKFGGFYWGGSLNYPIAGKDANFMTFRKK